MEEFTVLKEDLINDRVQRKAAPLCPDQFKQPLAAALSDYSIRYLMIQMTVRHQPILPAEVVEPIRHDEAPEGDRCRRGTTSAP